MTTSTPTVAQSAHVDLALRCATLRGQARLVGALDPSGWLAADLLDLADLLEVADREGWWSSCSTS